MWCRRTLCHGGYVWRMPVRHWDRPRKGGPRGERQRRAVTRCGRGNPTAQTEPSLHDHAHVTVILGFTPSGKLGGVFALSGRQVGCATTRR